MSLSTRHRWCIERISQCFQNENVDEEKVQGFIRRPDILNMFNALFSGDGGSSVFVHYQNKSDQLNVSSS